MNLKHPWKEIPKDQKTWEECKKQFNEALSLLERSSILTNKEEHRKGILEFLAEVQEPVEPIETITIREFKGLPSHCFTGGRQVYGRGRFAMSEEFHKKQCENVKVGDKVFFFLKIKSPDEKGSDADKRSSGGTVPSIDIKVEMARVVE